MKMFLSGFCVAAMLGMFLLYAQANGIIGIFASPEPPPEPALPMSTAQVDTDTTDVKKKPRKRARRSTDNQNNADSGKGWTQGDGESGDALESGAREVNGAVSGGEQQLSPGQIEAGMDRGFAGIERCLMLMPPDAPSSGRVVIGMNIARSGQVTRVNLKGTSAMISGDCGSCIQRIVKSLRFPSFSGPEMTAHYPINFD